jgi:phosphoserine phosphatase
MPGARELVGTMRKAGALTALVSGGFTFFTERVAKLVGFDVTRANTLNIENGRMTGTVADPILGREAKRAALVEYAAARGLALADTLAVGDGANDLDMLRTAGLGVAYRAKPIVAAEAHTAVTHGDLTSLLYLQGIAASDFAQA